MRPNYHPNHIPLVKNQKSSPQHNLAQKNPKTNHFHANLTFFHSLIQGYETCKISSELTADRIM